MLEKILEVLSLTEWKKKREVLKELRKEFKVSERQFRLLVAQNNKLFGQGVVDYYIAHSARGYKKTFDWNEMKRSIADNRKRAITMLVDCDKAEKAFQKRNQIKMNLEREIENFK